MLEVRDVRCGYDSGRGREEVLHGISLSIRKGERLYITGPNGCGKTTLLRCIAGLLPFRGTIELGGRDIRRIPRKELARQTGILSQISSVYFPYTVFDTVALGRYAHIQGVFGQLSPEDRAFAEQCLERVGLAELRNRPISELSGGQLQRVFLARLFAQDPELILLDEPTNHLDLKYQLELLEYVTAWSQEAGKTVVGVLHDLNLVCAFASQVALMNQGRILALGAPDDALSGELLQECYQIDVRSWMLQSLSNWKRG